ncbi:MAG: hypothetical protein ACOVP4_07230 [Bacteriovoracaceae bacterium]|jgi:hypothetical protein
MKSRKIKQLEKVHSYQRKILDVSDSSLIQRYPVLVKKIQQGSHAIGDAIIKVGNKLKKIVD